MKPTRLNRFQLRRLRELRRIPRKVKILVAAGFAAVVIATILPIATGRTAGRWYRLEAAKLAFVRAQEDGADAWAPDAMSQARAMLQVAVVEHRHQELRFLPLRDFTQAEDLLRDAEAKSQLASDAALRRRTGARNASREAITRAAQAVGRSSGIGAAMHLGSYDRRMLQRSKLALEEAELLQRAGKYALATDRARAATESAQKVQEHAVRAVARYTDATLIHEWRRMVDETIAWSRRTGSPAIVVMKEKHQLVLYVAGKPSRSYTAELGYNSVGDKARSGDAATPEGRYRITSKKGIGQSGYHMALLLDYPNAEDRRRFAEARRTGRIARNASLGGLIEIHGDGGRGRDWTKGCVALSNTEIQDLYSRVAVGTPVTIVGGDGNGGTFTRLVDLHRNGADPGMD